MDFEYTREDIQADYYWDIQKYLDGDMDLFDLLVIIAQGAYDDGHAND